MRTNPVGQRLRPGCLRVGEAGGAQHCDEDLCLADLSGQPIDDRQLLAGIIHEDLVAGDVLLAHRR